MDDGMTTHTGGRGDSGHGAPSGGGSRGAARIDPADRAQLAESPVELRRVLALFGPHRRALTIVTAIIARMPNIAVPEFPDTTR